MEGRHTRRSMLAAAGAALVVGGCGGSDPTPVSSTERDEPPAPGDLKIVAFALELEHLEAAFYDRLVEEGLLEGADQELAQVLREHEAEHVDSLQQALEEMGGTPPAPPEPDFEALLAGEPEAILRRASELGNLVAAGYLGQLERIQGDELLASTLLIHSVEARHAAALDQRIGRSFAPDGALAQALTMDAAHARLAGYLL